MNKTIFLPAVLLLGACASTSVVEQSREYTSFGQYARAFRVLDEVRRGVLATSDPVDPELERAWSAARLTYLIERGRSMIFAEYEDEALIALAGALALDPDHAEAKALHERATEKKADRAVRAGQELLGDRRLEEALTKFLEAEMILPTSAGAREGQEAVRVEVEKLTDRAQLEFLQAVRRLREFRYLEARWHSSNALANDPTREDAEDVRARARREIAIATMVRGRECQETDQFGAALIEFRAAKLLDAAVPGVDAAIAEVESEVKASELAASAQRRMRRRDFDGARGDLDKALELTTMQKAVITELMIENRRLQAERDYTVAFNFELQGLKQEALEGYVALAAVWSEGLHDEKVRIEALQSDIDNGRKEWELALAAEADGRLAEALDHYVASDRFYARLHDAKERIARLRAQLKQQGAEGGS